VSSSREVDWVLQKIELENENYNEKNFVEK